MFIEYQPPNSPKAPEGRHVRSWLFLVGVEYGNSTYRLPQLIQRAACGLPVHTIVDHRPYGS